MNWRIMLLGEAGSHPGASGSNMPADGSGMRWDLTQFNPPHRRMQLSEHDTMHSSIISELRVSSSKTSIRRRRVVSLSRQYGNYTLHSLQLHRTRRNSAMFRWPRPPTDVKQPSVSLSVSPVFFLTYKSLNVTLPAFAAERRHRAASRPAAVGRYFLLAGRSAANPPAVAAAVDRWYRQTDGQTDARPCSAH